MKERASDGTGACVAPRKVPPSYYGDELKDIDDHLQDLLTILATSSHGAAVYQRSDHKQPETAIPNIAILPVRPLVSFLKRKRGLIPRFHLKDTRNTISRSHTLRSAQSFLKFRREKALICGSLAHMSCIRERSFAPHSVMTIFIHIRGLHCIDAPQKGRRSVAWYHDGSNEQRCES